MSAAVRECLDVQRRQIAELLSKVGQAAHGVGRTDAVRLMSNAHELLERLLRGEELLLTPIYARSTDASNALQHDHKDMRAAAVRALELLEVGDVSAFADEAQILMAKLVTHGHREDAQLAAGRFVEGDPEHDALKARFLELLRA